MSKAPLDDKVELFVALKWLRDFHVIKILLLLLLGLRLQDKVIFVFPVDFLGNLLWVLVVLVLIFHVLLDLGFTEDLVNGIQFLLNV